MKKSLLVLFLSLSFISCTFGINRSDIAARSKSFKKYLVGLSWETSAPWPLILAGAKVLGLSQVEIDAIPISISFLSGEKYKKVFDQLETPDIIELINILIAQFEQKKSGLSRSKQRELLHHLIHELVLKELNLSSTMTTKQLARLVSEGAMSSNRLYEVQLAAFFVKHYLNI